MHILYCSKHSKDCKTVHRGQFQMLAEYCRSVSCSGRAVRWSVLQVSVRSGCFIVCSLFSVALLICCLVALFIIENGVLESPTVIVELSISPLISVSFFFRLLKFSFQLLYFFNTRIFIWFYYIISLHLM